MYQSEQSAPLNLNVDDAYRLLFEEAPVAMLLEDWSGVKALVEEVVAVHGTDIDAYIREHPSFFDDARRHHRFLDANRATLALFGTKDKEALLKLVPALLPAKAESNIHVIRAFAHGLAWAQGERLLHTLDGRRVPILWRVNIGSGRADRLLFVAVDVGALKNAEEALVSIQAELAHAGRVAVLGELAASIAHEVNQPLAAVQLFADTAVRWLNRREPDLDRAKAAIKNAGKSAKHATNVIGRMRRFVVNAQPESASLSINDVLADTALLVHRSAYKNGVLLDFHVPTELPFAFADRVQVQQVLVNLTMNAINALVEQDAPRRIVTIRAGLDISNWIRVEVGDSGQGVAPGNLTSVFEPFFTTRPTGMGLGLAICRSIVQSHGGEIAVSNQDGAGALFSFTLPCLLATPT